MKGTEDREPQNHEAQQDVALCFTKSFSVLEKKAINDGILGKQECFHYPKCHLWKKKDVIDIKDEMGQKQTEI